MEINLSRLLPPDVSLSDAVFKDVYWHHAHGFRAIDGDTFDAFVKVNEVFDVWKKKRFRLFAIDSPEMNSRDAFERKSAQAAKGALDSLIRGKSLTLYVRGKSFNRHLAWAWNADGVNISDEMVKLDHAEYKAY